MAELNTKMNTLSSATQSSDQARADEHASSSSKVVPAPTPDPPLILKASQYDDQSTPAFRDG